MKISLERKICIEIQKKLFSIIPEKWDKIFLYASVIDMPNKRVTGEMYFYYFPKGVIKTKPINCYEIPSAFNIDENEYANLISEIYNLIKNLRRVYFKNHQKNFSNITVSIENSRFKIEYCYDDLVDSEFDSYERHVIWRYIYLKTDIELFSKKDRKVIEKYLQNQTTSNTVIKDLYVENIYELPVKNIVDFEKILTVEEALAQNEIEDSDTKKIKHNFFKSKLKANDISENDQINSNQILNWKK